MTVDVAATPDGARIEVADTGVGIDPAELPHIFERFYRGSRANEARGSGSGLGLAIVHSIVDMHGGTVEVESRVGVGIAVRRHAAAGSAPGRGHPGGRTGRRGLRDAERQARLDDRHDASSPLQRDRERAGNFTVRAPAGEPGTRTLKT